MEAYNMPQAGTGPGLCGSDREVFERVWRRVMPVDTYGSPVQLIGEETLPEPRLYDTAGGGPDPWLPEPPVPQPVPQPVPPPSCPVCLGPSSAAHGAQLQAFIADELADHRRYLALAHRTKGNAARALSAMAADEQRHAKRLSTAYFLISGVHYWPNVPCPQTAGPLPACLRQAFLNEQKGECGYRGAASETADACLRELYLELAGDENSHTWLIRGLLEGR